MCRTVRLCFLLLFHHLFAAQAQLQVQLNFYTDTQCTVPSTTEPVASVPISECIVTTGLTSISFQPVPCTSGDVQLVAFSDTACGTALGISDWYRSANRCWARYSGDIAAIQLTCNQVDDAGNINPGTPTATSTVLIAPVAGGAPTATQATASSLPTSDNGDSSTAPPTAASSSSPSSSGSSGTSGTNGSSTGGDTNSSPPSSSKLSTSDVISLAVGLGVGIPTIIIALVGICCCRGR